MLHPRDTEPSTWMFSFLVTLLYRLLLRVWQVFLKPHLLSLSFQIPILQHQNQQSLFPSKSIFIFKTDSMFLRWPENASFLSEIWCSSQDLARLLNVDCLFPNSVVGHLPSGLRRELFSDSLLDTYRRKTKGQASRAGRI